MLSQKSLLFLPDFIFCPNAAACNTFQGLESFHSNIRETLQRRVGVNAKEAERYSDGVPGGSSRPAALCIHILSPGGSWNRELGEVKVRSWSCSNTLDYRRGPHPSTPECSRVGTSAAAEQHVSGGTREKKKEKKKSACTRSTSGTSSSHDGKSQEVNRENVNPHRRLQIQSLYY